MFLLDFSGLILVLFLDPMKHETVTKSTFTLCQCVSRKYPRDKGWYERFLFCGVVQPGGGF